MCLCVFVWVLARSECCRHVNVYLFQLTTCSLRDAHTRVKWLPGNRVNGDQSMGQSRQGPSACWEVGGVLHNATMCLKGSG